MSNTWLAVEFITNYFESEGISCGTAEIIKRVEKWEAKLDPIDFISLAAVAIANPSESALTKAEIREIREFYFPSEDYIERNLF